MANKTVSTTKPPPTPKQTAKKYDDIIKASRRIFNKANRGKGLKFEDSQDYKTIQRRKKKELYRLENREKDITRKREARKRVRESLEKSEGKYTDLADGPFFEVLSYSNTSRNSILWKHANQLRKPEQKYIGIIQFEGGRRRKYETITGFFTQIRELYEFARTVNSGLYARISEYNDPNIFVQMVEIFADESEFENE